MQHWLWADEWKHLSALEQAARCRKMADVTYRLSTGGRARQRHACARIAAASLRLADEIERDHFWTMI
jgi:hypothetical protein